MNSLLQHIKLQLAIATRNRSNNMLDGEYASTFKGRSMDFDDLHEYVAGDDVKDIDWRSSLRVNRVLVKRYIAERKNSVLLIANAGYNMNAANSDASATKLDLLISICGIIGLTAKANGDLVGMLCGHDEENKYRPFRSTNTHLELSLRDVYLTAKAEQASGNLLMQLERATKIDRKMTVVIVSDEHELTDNHLEFLSKLSVRCEIMWVTVCDYEFLLAGKDVYDIDAGAQIPVQLLDKKLIASFIKNQYEQRANRVRALARYGIAHQYVRNEQAMVNDLTLLLERHRHARSR